MTARNPDLKSRLDHNVRWEQIEQLAASLADDPLRFIAICWPDMRIYAKQEEILLSVRDNVETFVYAANETGKTRTAAIVALWFFLSRQPARVITSSSSETQLDAILWSEIRYLIATSKFPLPLIVNYLSIKKRCTAEGTDVASRDYLIGHVTNLVENFQGHHLPNDKPRVLAVFMKPRAFLTNSSRPPIPGRIGSW